MQIGTSIRSPHHDNRRSRTGFQRGNGRASGEDIMTQSTHNRVAELHNLAAHAHAAAAAAHNKADQLTAHELSKQAHELSMNAHRFAEERFAASKDFKRP